MRFRIPTYEVGVLQSRAHRALRNFLSEELKTHDLSLIEWSVIGLLMEKGKQGMRASELAQLLEVQISLITNTVNSLERKQLLRRSPLKDRRAKRIVLTAPSARSARKIEKHLRAEMRGFLSEIPPSEFNAFLSTLQKMATKL